jgi:signal transduction histidine kinase/DNA-binding response OmpR family regulator
MAELSQPAASIWAKVRGQAALLVIGLGLLFGAGIMALTAASNSVGQLAEAATRARAEGDAANDLLLAIEEAESGERGYLLTGDPDYLRPYQHAMQEIGPLLARLDALAESAPWLQEEGAELREAARRKMDSLARTIVVARAQGRETALQLVQGDGGRQDMERAQLIANAISTRAERERAAHAAALQARQQTITALTLAGLAAGLLVLMAAGLRLLWNRAALLRAREGERLEADRLQAAVEHVPEGVAVFDRKGRLTLQNTRFAPTIGLPPDHVQAGTTLSTLAAETDMEPPALAGPRPDGRPVVTEARVGTRVLEVWRSSMPHGGQIVAVADISRRVQAEAIARQAQKMEMVGQMTGGIAHDFNNLLQVVSANIELAATRIGRSGGDPSALERLDAASTAVARGAQLTRHMLAFARRQPLAPEAVDPARLLLSLEDMLRRTLGEAVELKVAIGPSLWAMRADPTQMESALLNLTLNARDAMTRSDGVASGRMTLEVSNAVLDEAYAGSHDEVEPGDYVMFAVTDNGIGMTREQLGRATEPFYTTKPEGKGTGLGLPMVFGFAKQSGGHFQLYSEPGHGTTARIYIPRTSSQVEPAPKVKLPPQEAQGELVLVVEDDVFVRRVAAAALDSLGYEVHEAGNADEAVALLRMGLRPAVLFTDVVMPGTISSRDLATQAQRMVPGLAVLFTSGYTQEAMVHNGHIAPGINLLSKPWRTEELGQALRAALDSARRKRLPPTRRRVLLVEDEALVRMTTADALDDLGFEVIEAATATAALERLEPAPDLLFTDLGLPDMDGYELIARVRKRFPDMPIVIASGRMGEPGSDAIYLLKPYDGQDLRRAVGTALRERVLAD